MLRFEITFHVFDGVEYMDTVQHVYEFRDSTELTETLVRFASQESPIKYLLTSVNEGVRHLDPAFVLPHVKGGLGPTTNILIAQVRKIE